MDIVLNQVSEVPIYSQIYSQISRQILSGGIKPEEQLPTIRNIANDLKISVIPVKMAWEALEKNGFIFTVPGRGTFARRIDGEEIAIRHQKELQKIAEEACKKARDLNLGKEELLAMIEKCF